MSFHPNYHRCMRHMGRHVMIRTVDGNIHRGLISRVTPTHVYLQPMPVGNRGRFGYGYGYWGFGWGFGVGIALGAIVGIAATSWWW